MAGTKVNLPFDAAIHSLLLKKKYFLCYSILDCESNDKILEVYYGKCACDPLWRKQHTDGNR